LNNLSAIDTRRAAAGVFKWLASGSEPLHSTESVGNFTSDFGNTYLKKSNMMKVVGKPHEE